MIPPPDNEELLRPVRHQRDTAGTVWIGPDAVYRRIAPDYRDTALRLLNSPLFAELVERRLFPRTRVNPEALSRGELLLDHERAPFILYGWEWSFSMLKEAATVLLDVAETCERRGYSMQDAHVYNVVFFSGRPMFVDFGSIREGQTGNPFQYKEFLRYYYVPLALWSDGDFYIANRLLRDNVSRRLQPFSRLEDMPAIRKYVLPFRTHTGIRHRAMRRFNAILRRVPPLRETQFCMPPRPKIAFSFAQMRDRLAALSSPPVPTEWEGYHDGNFARTTVPPRFSRILEVLGSYRWHTAVDVAGNGGYFTELLAKRFEDASFLCLDYDSRAIDKAYARIRASPDLNGRITMGVVNILHPEGLTLRLEERIRSDLVLALAITHHLLLRQQADVERILQFFHEVSRRYLAVEFMPLGLWNGKTAPPTPPWYTRDWFRTNLKKWFRVLVEEQLGTNRILFFCEKQPAPPVRADAARTMRELLQPVVASPGQGEKT